MNSLVVISDRGSQYLPDCIDSARTHLPFDWFDRRILVDDSGEPNDWPDDFEVIAHETRKGLAGAVQSAWSAAEGSDYVFHLEEDFSYNEPVELVRMSKTLTGNRSLCQLVLKRQPCNQVEREAGSVVGLRPNDYYDRWNHLEHDIGFSLNPCLIPGWVLLLGWPDGGGETEFNAVLPSWARFAVWGQRDDPPAVTHHGEVRSPAWRL